MQRKDFTVTLEDGTTVEVYVTSPTTQDKKEGQKVYNTAFNEAVRSGAIVRAKLDDILVEQGLWNDQKQIKFETIQREISDCEAKLEKGGISLSAAKEIALRMRTLRAEFREVISDKTSLDTHSAEGQADTERFSYLVYACTYKKDTKSRYFPSYQAYQDAGDDPVSVAAAGHLANIVYALEADYEKKLPENKFLRDYKFVDENLRFINKKGQFTDIEGKLVDKNGRYINEEGEFVDKYGRLIDEEGHYKVDFVPFTDDDGNPVVLETSESSQPEEETEEKAKKTTKKKKVSEVSETE